MFERNDGKGINAIQNKFTSMLKTALHNHRIDYASHYIPSVVGRNPISYSEPKEISMSQTVQRTLYWKRRQMEGIMILLFSHRPSVEA